MSDKESVNSKTRTKTETETDVEVDTDAEVESDLEELEEFPGIEDFLQTQDGETIADLMKSLVKNTTNIAKHLQNQNTILTVIAKGLKE